MKPTVEREGNYEAKNGFKVHYEANNYGRYCKINTTGNIINSDYEPEDVASSCTPREAARI